MFCSPSDVLRMQRRGRLSPFQELLVKVDTVIDFQVLFNIDKRLNKIVKYIAQLKAATSQLPLVANLVAG